MKRGAEDLSQCLCLAMGQLRSAPTSFSHPTLQAISLPSLLFVLKIENIIEFDYIHTHTVHAKYCKHFLFVCFIFFEAVRPFFFYCVPPVKLYERTTLQAAKNKIDRRSDRLRLFLENRKGLAKGYFCLILTPSSRDASLSLNSPCNTNAVSLFALFQLRVHITRKSLAKL